jgi:archaellum component FlaC
MESKNVNNFITLETLEKALLRNNQILRKSIELDTKKIVEEAVDELAVSVKKGFDRVDERFEKIDEKFEKIDEKFEKIDEKFNKIDGRLHGIDMRLNGIECRLGGLDRRMDDFAVSCRRKKNPVKF